MISTLKNKFRIKNDVLIIAFLTLLISFKSSNQWSTLPVGNELFWWIVQFMFIYILFKLKKKITSPTIETNLVYIKLYIFWNIICIIRGVFVAENYWEWKMLIGTTYLLLLPLIVYITNSYTSLQIIVKTWFKYGLIVYILFSPFLWGDAVGKFLMPISFLLLFYPVLNTKWKFIVIGFSVFVVTFDITARSNIIKFAIPLLIGLLYYIRNMLSNKILNTTRLLFLFMPIGLIFLGISGVFNVFKLDQYLGEQTTKTKSISGEVTEENLTADTRTGLYIEVIESALNNNYVIFGRTPARGNDSLLFGETTNEITHSKKMERFSNEVSILNIFTWLGIVGVVLYFLVFIKATYLAINESNNIFIKLIGLNISFRWIYGFVEDFSRFDLSNIFLWLMIGMCFSESFRQMTDAEMKYWVRGIFEKQWRIKRKITLQSIE